MCGIFFSIGFENLPPSVIDSVTHRGPDGRGWNEFSSPSGPVVMAHRRLAIVDLSEDGHQPMASDDDRYWVSYNGEIYNYLEIQKELEALGHYFKTKTDTEVLLKSYLQWGPDCLNHFNGMFAFVIWDDKEKKVFTARDRFGVKPLYYYRQGNKIAFASEIKQFKHLPEWKSVLHQEMAQEYLNKDYCDHKDTTLYINVLQVLPGNYLNFSALEEKKDPVSWYHLKDHIFPRSFNDNDAIEEFRNIFEDAIRLRLRSDVPSGSCLSGGLDSSSIVSMIRAITPPDKKVYTFSSVFPGHAVDESRYIDELVTKKNLTSFKNHPMVDEFMSNVDKILFYQDLPFAGASVFAQWKTFQSAKTQGVTVLLDGQGADESLLGYPGMLYGLIFDYLKTFQMRDLISLIKWYSVSSNLPLKKLIMMAIQQRNPSLYRQILKCFRKTSNGTVDLFSSEIGGSINNMCLHFFYNNFQTLLRYADRNSMAFGRESRMPFLDYRIVELAMSLNVNQRFRNNQTKWVLRKSMHGLNIESILERKDKNGFATPEEQWRSSIKLVKIEGFKSWIFNRWLSIEGLALDVIR